MRAVVIIPYNNRPQHLYRSEPVFTGIVQRVHKIDELSTKNTMSVLKIRRTSIKTSNGIVSLYNAL